MLDHRDRSPPQVILYDTFFQLGTHAESCSRFWLSYHKSQSFCVVASHSIWTPLGGTRRWSCCQCCKMSSFCQHWRHMLTNSTAEVCLVVKPAHVTVLAHASMLRLPEVQPVLLLRMMMVMHNSHCCLGMPWPHLAKRAETFMRCSVCNWASKVPCSP